MLQGHPFPPNPAHAPCGSTGRNMEAPGICSLYSSAGRLKVFRLMLFIKCCYVSQDFDKNPEMLFDVCLLSCLYVITSFLELFFITYLIAIYCPSLSCRFLYRMSAQTPFWHPGAAPIYCLLQQIECAQSEIQYMHACAQISHSRSGFIRRRGIVKLPFLLLSFACFSISSGWYTMKAEGVMFFS